MIRPLLEKIPFELLKCCKPNITHPRVFDSKCPMHNDDKDALGKFDAKVMRLSSLVIVHIVSLIKHITKKPCVLKKVYMLFFTKLITLLRKVCRIIIIMLTLESHRCMLRDQIRVFQRTLLYRERQHENPILWKLSMTYNR